MVVLAPTLLSTILLESMQTSSAITALRKNELDKMVTRSPMTVPPWMMTFG